MTRSEIPRARKKKIKTVLSMMNKQNKRLLPVTPPLIEMMDLVAADDELDFLLKMGVEPYNYEQAAKAADMPEDEFQTFFYEIQRRGLVHVELYENGKKEFRINAVAVGWYEVMSHYLIGQPLEKAFAQKWNDYLLFFRNFNFPPLRNAQDLVLRQYLTPNQNAGVMDPKIPGKTKRKTIPINASVSHTDSMVHPTFHLSELIEEFGDKDAICVFPCVCRYGNRLIESPCDFKLPGNSCIVFGHFAEVWVDFGFGRHVSKEEAIDILKEVRENGAVHSVIHERDDCSLPVIAICNCCWDCCSILKPYNMGSISVKYNSTYIARIKDDPNCKGCGNCEKFCPTTAMKVKDKQAVLNSDLCIGCGQCAFQCRQNNIELCPDERTVYLPILKKSEIRVPF